MRSKIRAQKTIVIKKIAFLSILIKLNSFVTKTVFWPPQSKNPGYGTALM
jgi:hypothetical protein